MLVEGRDAGGAVLGLDWWTGGTDDTPCCNPQVLQSPHSVRYLQENGGASLNVTYSNLSRCLSGFLGGHWRLVDALRIFGSDGSSFFLRERCLELCRTLRHKKAAVVHDLLANGRMLRGPITLAFAIGSVKVGGAGEYGDAPVWSVHQSTQNNAALAYRSVGV
jgi:hypothetical protein